MIPDGILGYFANSKPYFFINKKERTIKDNIFITDLLEINSGPVKDR